MKKAPFIQLTSNFEEKPIFINALLVSSYHKNFSNPDLSYVQLVGGDDTGYSVHETPEEISRKIEEALSR